MSRLASVVALPRTVWLMAVLLLSVAPALAQDTARQAPAHVALVEGTAILERDGETDSSPASMPLLAGDRLRTRAGRVEILYAEGSTLHLDANTVVDFQSDEVIRLLEGRIRLNIVGPSRQVGYRIDAPTAWVEVRQPGEYRVAVLAGERGAEVELAVLRGAADLVNENGSTELLAGERAFAAAALAPSEPYVFNSAAWDAFDRWSEARRDQRLGISAQYLPAEARPYAASLDHYGSWRHEPTYGYVWYPRVAVGWRPYYYGRWSHLRPWGWTWIGHDPWAWPTHHYGRWGFSSGVWFWIPGRHWGPAWVSWAYAPGYVSWCPLGWNNRPVFGFVSVNVFGGRRYTPWHGWTVVPHRRFGSGFVNINVVNVNRIDARTRGAFEIRTSGPQYTGRVAVPRAQAPITIAGSRSGVAVPREGSAVRDRNAGVERSSGSGFPAPARAPRSSAVPRSGNRSAPIGTTREPDATDRRAVAPRAVPRAGTPGVTPGPERGTPSRRTAPDGARAPSAPARGSGSPSAAPGPVRPRAVPRTTQPSATPAPGRGAPSRVAPRGGGSTTAPASGEGSTAPSASRPARSRAVVPRRSGGSASPTPEARSYRSVPSQVPSYRSPVAPERAEPVGRNRAGVPAYGAPDRRSRRAPEQPAYQGPRSIPRSSPAAPPTRVYGSDPRGSRSSGSVRPMPSAPPAPPSQRAAEPAQGQNAPSTGSPSRSRGGQQSSGAARRRGGGNE